MAKKRNRQISWEEIKKAFTQGMENDTGNRYYPTIVQLSNHFKIAQGTIKSRCAKEQWAELRQMLSTKIAEVTTAKTIEAVSEAGSNFDLKTFNGANRLLDVCLEKAEKASAACDVEDLKKLAESMKTIQVVGRLALGEPIDIARNQSKVELNDLTDPARLEFELEQLLLKGKAKVIPSS
jgi:hypothetical protein